MSTLSVSLSCPPSLPPMTKAAVLHAHRFNWRVLPIRARGKKPIIKGWPEKATRDLDTIRKWWRRHPDVNVGVAIGKASGVIALDVDVDKGGDDRLYALTERYGPLPTTAEAARGVERIPTHLPLIGKAQRFKVK